MKMKSKTLIIEIIMNFTLIVSVDGYYSYRYIKVVLHQNTWIRDLGYKENEIHDLTFNFDGDGGCPEIPVNIGNDEYKLGFGLWSWNSLY